MHSRVVLLADDEAIVRNLAAITLEREEFLVLSACDGREALELARSSSEIDLLLTDVQMGEASVDGFVLAERILEEKPGTRILVMSGRPHSEAIAAEKGFPFLPKPFTPALLAQRVREVLGAIPAQSEDKKPRHKRQAG